MHRNACQIREGEGGAQWGSGCLDSVPCLYTAYTCATGGDLVKATKITECHLFCTEKAEQCGRWR
jgi:hypothetical protein